ncbi:MAG: glycosyltransferase [Chloroflexi bacterium]|nr:glycosyltransferase [Chloroflexota bacterium]
MSNPSIPSDVRELLRQRTDARADRDWGRADALREQLTELGWQVEDGPSGSTVRPILSTATSRDDSGLPSRLEEAASVEASVQVLAEDHPADLGRFLGGLRSHAPGLTWELVVVANAPSFDLDALLAEPLPAAETTVLRAGPRLGWADARTLGLRRSSGEVTILVDTSVEPVGDFVTPLVAAFEDPTVGIAGPFGVRSPDGRHFAEAPPGEVDAVEAYCLGLRRDALRAVGGFDPGFRYYRNGDLDLSFAVRDAGWRAARTPELPLRRHAHRDYESVTPEERDRLSRRNFYRFLKHWGDRRDLLLGRRD